MGYSIEYDTATGSICGVLSPGLPPGTPMPPGRGIIYSDSYVDPSMSIVDITQNPPAIIPYTAPIDYTSQAQQALAASDKTILRCVENGVAVPAVWVTYRQALRAIVDGTQQDTLPPKPGYPPGT